MPKKGLSALDQLVSLFQKKTTLTPKEIEETFKNRRSTGMVWEVRKRGHVVTQKEENGKVVSFTLEKINEKRIVKPTEPKAPAVKKAAAVKKPKVAATHKKAAPKRAVATADTGLRYTPPKLPQKALASVIDPGFSRSLGFAVDADFDAPRDDDDGIGELPDFLNRRKGAE